MIVKRGKEQEEFDCMVTVDWRPPKRRFEPRKNPLRARVSGNRCNNKLWYFAFYYWNSPNSTDFGNARLVVMTMVEGIKKRKRKKNFAWWKENSNFSLSYSVLNLRFRSHSTLVQNQTTGHFTSGFEQKKKKPGLKFNLGLALIKLGTSEPRPTIWWHSSVCCLELGTEQFWPARTLRYTVSDLRVRVRRHLCPCMVMTPSQYILSQPFQFTRLVPKPSY